MTGPIVIDTDPGIDDALAIALAAGSPAVELLGITTVFGNVGLDRTTANGLALRDYLGLDATPVVAGADRPLLRELVDASEVHGHSGLGDAQLPDPHGELAPGHAANFLSEVVRSRPGEVTIVAVGPLTNVALAVRLDPEIATLARGLVIMGGAAAVPGNATPAAEFNIFADPEAAAIAFRAGWTVTMVGLDATLRSRPTPEQFALMSQHGRLSAELLDPCLNFYTQHTAYRGLGPAVHDACAVAHVLEPGILELRPAQVDVETSGLAAGMTVTDFAAPADRCNAQVAVDVDGDALWKLMDTAYGELAGRVPRSA